MKKLQRIESTQNFSPVRDVRNGIIITTDGRFIKLMEFSPINFDLRSIDEQDAIIAKFHAALRSMPNTVQFKCVTKAADLTIFINNLLDSYEAEKNENCRRLIEEQINFISSLGSSMGTSRHFYVAFEYEPQPATKKTPSFEEIAATLDRQGTLIAHSLKECGNGKISRDNDDDWTLSALYSIFRRSEAERITFDKRIANVVANYASDNASDISEALMLPVNNFICPDKIDPGRSPNYIVIDGTYYTFAVIRGDSYPTRAIGGWTLMLVGLGEGIDFDMFYTKVDPAKASRQIQAKIRFGALKLEQTDISSADFDAQRSQLQSAQFFKSSIASGDEFCYFGGILTITAYSADDLERRVAEVKNICIRADLKLRFCMFQQLNAFQMTLPVCKLDPSLWSKAKRNILLSQFASAYPFTSFEMSDNNGVLLGTSVQNGSMVFIDPFDTSKYTNANISLFGTSGSGKTYTVQLLAVRKRMKGEQIFIIAPMKGEEFEKLCKATGGAFIRIAPGSSQNINIMEIRKKDEAVERERDSYVATESILAQKIQQLHIFFTYIMSDPNKPITQEEKNILDQALIATYKKFGITQNNKSLIDKANPSQYKKMPVLGDLYTELEKFGEDAARLCSALSIFVTGSASSFNGPTNVDLDNKFIVIDISHLPKDLLPVGMFIATDYVWDKARENRNKRKTIIIDEVWRLIGGYASEAAAEFVLDIFKVIRGYGGSAVAATQDLNDILTLNGGQFGSAILNNTRFKMILRIESQHEAENLGRVLELTEKEVETIRMMDRGTGLLIANYNHVFVKVKASKMEHELIAYGGAR